MAEPMSPEGYAAAGGVCCPSCGGAVQCCGPLHVSGAAILVPQACLACLARWRAVYELAGYEPAEETHG
jgi:hypothetical protein